MGGGWSSLQEDFHKILNCFHRYDGQFRYNGDQIILSKNFESNTENTLGKTRGQKDNKESIAVAQDGTMFKLGQCCRYEMEMENVFIGFRWVIKETVLNSYSSL